MTYYGVEVDKGRLEALHEEMDRLDMRGFWRRLEQTPEPPLEPQRWRWADIYRCLTEAGEVIPPGIPGADRRNVGLQTRSRTLSMGFQLVKPGEVAPAHRHTFSAMRFVVMGNGGAYTTTEGERFSLSPGDLVTQPTWGWHDHTNDSGEPVIWIDGLEAGLVSFLDVAFREVWAEGDLQPITKPDGYSRRVFGGAVRTQGLDQGTGMVPFHYKWSETRATLEELAAAGKVDPYDGVLLEYTNPLTGGHTFRNYTCHIQMLRPGEATRAHRHTGTTLYHAVEGQGVTTVDKTSPVELDWGVKDSFLVPSWRWHQHRNSSKSEPAILFSYNDRPVLESTGFYWEEGE